MSEETFTLVLSKQQLNDLQDLMDEGRFALEEWERYLAANEPDEEKEALLSRTPSLISHVDGAWLAALRAEREADLDAGLKNPPTSDPNPSP